MNLSKIDDEWQLDKISDTDEQKINGVYYYQDLENKVLFNFQNTKSKKI